MTDLQLFAQNKDYGIFGLTENPFPYAGIPDTVPEFYIGQDDVILKIGQTLSTTISTGKSAHLILTGSYGNGKSHTLKYIQSQVDRQFRQSSNTKPIAAYVAQPGESFLDIYRETVYDLGAEFIKSVSRLYLGRIAEQLVQEGKIEVDTPIEDGWQSIEDGTILLSDVVPPALNELKGQVKFPDFCKAFLNMAYEENSITSWEWLCGEMIEYTRRRELKLTTNIHAKHAQRAFLGLKTVLELTGYAPFILLIDEFEFIDSLQARTKQNMLNAIRHLIDTNPHGFSLLIACAPEVWGTLVSEYHAFSERIAREINLKPLNESSIKNLVIAYLNKGRITPNTSIDPFTESAITTIFKYGNGNTRQIITLCSLCLENAFDQHNSVIDETIVNNVVSQ